MRLCPECQVEYGEAEDHLCPAEERPLKMPASDPLIGTRLSDRYEIISVLGRGGMGVVYKARHVYMERFVAVKMLHAHLVTDADAIRRFKQEAQAVSSVRHPHTVTLYDFGLTDCGQPFLVMDYIDGFSLRQLVKKDGPLPLSRAHNIFLQVVDALSCAHHAGVTHRDLKPENIMLTEKSGEQDWVEVVDFGISGLASLERIDWQGTISSDMRGSPRYMSPEQCQGDAVIDHRSDIYSLGVVLYEALSGKLPYQARSVFEMVECHKSASAVPLRAALPSLAPCESLTQMIGKALEKNAEKRQQTIDQFGSELTDAIKSDASKLRSLKHRPELMSPQVTQPYEIKPTAKTPENPPPEQYAQIPEKLFASMQEGNLTETLIETVSKIKVDAITKITGQTPVADRPSCREADGPQPDRVKPGFWQSLYSCLFGDAASGKKAEVKYVFINCPHCSEPVEQGIAFCLSCGRSLATTHDFSKVRVAQGVFSLPRSQDTGESPVPVFSQKARKAMVHTGRAWSKTTALLLVSFLLVMCVFCMAGGLSVVTRAASHLLQVIGDR